MAFLSEPSLWNFYRLGPAKERDYFKRNKDTYTGIIIPANIACYYSKFSYELLSDVRKPYFIDPITYIFARDPNILRKYLKGKDNRTIKDVFNKKKRGDFKVAYKKLAESYEGVIKSSLEKGIAITPSDFTQTEIESLTKKVVEFQLSKVSQLPEKYKKYSKYADSEIRGNLERTIKPEIIIPPYFYFDSIKEADWFGVNKSFVNSVKKVYPEEKIFPVIATSLDSLEKYSNDIISDYSQLEVDGFILWPDNFKGNKNYNYMLALKLFIQNLSKYGKPIILLYSDAISLPFYYAGLSGYSCGICYGESKSIDQDIDPEGEIPPRYYIPALKIKIPVETQLQRIDLALYPDFKCNCQTCSTFENPLVFDEEQTKDHFMKARHEEIKNLRKISISEFKKELFDSYEKYKDHAVLHQVKHLLDWHNLL